MTVVSRCLRLGEFFALALLMAVGADLAAEEMGLTPGFETVYPTPSGALRFSHKAHTGLECLRCHPDAAGSTRVSERLLPEEKLCADCHGDKLRKTANEPGDEARCAFCHADFDPLNRERPSRIGWPEARLHFPHDQHVQRMIACDTCHVGIAESNTLGRHLPKESLCLSCHPKASDGNNCRLCHTGQVGPGITTDFKGERLAPSQGRLAHQGDWTKRHALESRMNRESCRPCHSQNECNRCHDGVMKPMRVHPEDYATMHPIDARQNEMRCKSCHRFQSSCLDCHKKLGVTADAERKSARVRIHPEGFGACVAGANHHAFQARRNLAVCISCHQENDCLACHKSGAACGGAVNIHGHLSDSELSRMQAKNPRACRKCHENK